MVQLSTILVSSLMIFASTVQGQSPYFSVFVQDAQRGQLQGFTGFVTVPAISKTQKNAVVAIPAFISNSYFYQPTLVSYGDPRYPTCTAVPGQWCVYTQYGTTNVDTPTTNGTAKVVLPNDKIQFTLQRTTTTITQRILKNGQVLVQASNTDPVTPPILLIGTQCKQNPASIPAITFTNVEIRLSKKDTRFTTANYFGRNLVTDSGAYSTDGGLTYKINSLAFQAYNCPAD